MWKIEHQILHIKKKNIRKILNCNCYIKNADIEKIQKVKKNIKKQGAGNIVKNK